MTSSSPHHLMMYLFAPPLNRATVVQEVEKSFSNQRVACSIPCRSVLEQDTEPLIAPDVQCAISVNVKCVYIVIKSHICKSLWIKASAKCKKLIFIGYRMKHCNVVPYLLHKSSR